MFIKGIRMNNIETMKLAQDLRALADRFSEGWHDGIKIDASDIVLLATVASAIEQAQQAEPVTIWYMRDNHTFKKLSEDVSTALIEIEQEFNEGHTYGMLCSKRKGFPSVHASGDKKRLEFFAECKATLEQWLPKTSPPPRQPLTDEEIKTIFKSNIKHDITDAFSFARAIEAAVWEKQK